MSDANCSPFHPSQLSRRLAVWLVMMSWVFLPKAHAVLFYDTGSAAHNIAAPTGTYENAGWQYQGYYGAYLGTMIAPQYFLTAQHMGTQGSSFVSAGLFNGGVDVTYTIDTSANGGAGYWDIAGTDLRILKINEYFPTYATLYTGSSEQGLDMVTMGRGGVRGADVMVSGTLHGWKHNVGDGVARWGSNIVSDVTPLPGLGDMLVAEFDTSGPGHTAEESTLSEGDSGGGVFVNDGGIWKLAGINYSVDGLFDTNNTTGDGTQFNAALFDRGGLYQGSDGQGWTLIPNVGPDNPSSLYASRISTNAAAIQAIAVVPEPHSVLLIALAGMLTMKRRQRRDPR
ncbi:MAG: PEP-CTERM sorting domain-containing protein [Verrucomicrobiaceae bacterium]|nr:PEP-CTERM sorting domain-containing protein [Verrucomicrobiaceae bacterium]